jgi:D-arabinitol 4-dehydrogenase
MNAIVPHLSRPTVLHLGLGSFHRAHQAAYQQRLIDTGDTRWALVGANLRPDLAQTLDALSRQGGAYTLETIAPDGLVRYQRIEAMSEVIPYVPGLAAVVARGADPATRVISFTVTEAGYCLDGSGALDIGNPDLAADLDCARQGRPGATIYGVLCAILQARRSAQAGPVTLLSCDNLRHNGDRLRTGLLAFMQLAQLQELAEWAGQHISCPNAMVDRITPRPPPELRERVQAATGWDDAAAVTAESFSQWVIEDRFVAGRPSWERVGVEMVSSVAPYEEAKIRILNASHSCIAWAGTLAGLRFIHEGSAVPTIRRMAWDYVTQDVIPCLAMPGEGSALDLPAYRERIAQGASIDAVAMLPALFLVFLQRWHHDTLPYAYQDQAMDPAVAHAICAAADPVAALCAELPLWGEAAGHPHLVGAVRRATDRVHAFVQQAVR